MVTGNDCPSHVECDVAGGEECAHNQVTPARVSTCCTHGQDGVVVCRSGVRHLLHSDGMLRGDDVRLLGAGRLAESGQGEAGTGDHHA
eukprot:scaffold8214_cov121-Isochrysis_galbana.AAC.3